jgi:hypothetical protein
MLVRVEEGDSKGVRVLIVKVRVRVRVLIVALSWTL